MFNFHWLARENYSIEELKSISSKLNEAGYESVLFTYHSQTPDTFIKIPRIIDINHKIKYMIAIRPHAISPEYLQMQCDGFNEIQKDRLIINFVAGDIMSGEDQPIPLINKKDTKTDLESRKENLVEFLEIFSKLSNNRSQIAITGTSDILIKAAEKYAGTLISPLYAYNNIVNSNINKKIIAVRVFIRDTQDEVDSIIKNNPEYGLNPEYSGAEDKVIKSILKLHNKGIKDIMLAAVFGDLEKDRIHNLVKKIKEFDSANI